MRKRRTGPVILLLLLVVLAVAGVAGWLVLGREFTFVLTRDYLQSQLITAFPYEKKELLYSLSVRDPKLLLNENSDRIGLSVNVEVGILGGKKIAGSLTADAGLRYDAAKTAFFLDNPRVTEAKIPGLPQTIAAKVPDVATVALQAVLKEKPIYQLTDEDAGRFLLRRTLKTVKIRQGQVEATLGVR